MDLKQNFRSRHQVTDCVNGLFLQLMHRELGGVEYDADAALYPAAVFPEETEELYEPELLIGAAEDGGEDPKRLEARLIAGRIRELVGRFPVRDSETGQLRAARYQDIVILLRTTSNWDEEFKKVLEENGVPVFVTSKTGYFAATEVQTVLNFLRVLNNPLQDIPLFGVL
ncbi:MAG: 3'-5' exonuclease [Eisenbergiella sp.]